MAEHKKKGNDNALGIEIDFYTIARDVLKNWWMILALSISVALLSYVQVSRSYTPSYSIEAIYVVTARGVNNGVYENLSTAQSTVSSLSQIINSTTLLNKVAEELGTGWVPGTIEADVIPETNLLTLSVTAGSPEMAFRILRSVMQNYPTISDYLIGGAILEVLMAPVIPTEPDNPLQVKDTVVKAFFTAMLLISLVLAVISYLKDTIRSASDVEKKLDTRLLGSLCHEEKNKTLAAKVHKSNSSLLITNPMISFRYGEMMQKTCRKVQNRMEHRGAKSLLVTSYLENEGKSTVTANIALALARSGKKVVLVDLDLRKPSQYKIFDLFDQEMTELGDALNGEQGKSGRMIRALFSKEIYTVFNTKEYTRSTEMLTTGKLEVILEFLKEKFDYVIIDTPPMAYVADTEEIANLVDASLIVVREHGAAAKDINDMIDVLSGCQAAPIGCVFNDAHNSVGGTVFGESGYGYGKGYGYGYGYGYGKYYAKTEK